MVEEPSGSFPGLVVTAGRIHLVADLPQEQPESTQATQLKHTDDF